MSGAMSGTLPLFQRDGETPDDGAFDFIHIVSIASRAAIHHWTIRAHRHRTLFQILLIESGGGEMTFEASRLPFAAPAAILIPATVAHGFRFEPEITGGWVLSFCEDAAGAFADRTGEAMTRLRALAAQPIVPIDDDAERARLSALCVQLHDESSLGRDGYQLAMQGLLVLIATGVARLAARRARAGDTGGGGNTILAAAEAGVAKLRALIEESFRTERLLGFYAAKLGVGVDRLNALVKEAAGVTPGHLIRQRLLIEAKHQLAFTAQPIHEISQNLGFADQSHFARFFRKQTGAAPHEFRERCGG